MPSTAQRALLILTHLFLTVTLQSEPCIIFIFRDKKTDRVHVTCPRHTASHLQGLNKASLNPDTGSPP